MNELYNAADVFFLPSFDELFPMTLLESMCCHKPILVRDLDLYSCILEGYYTAASDVDGFVSQLRALTDPAVHSAAARPLCRRASALYQSGGAFLLEKLLRLFIAAGATGAAGAG